MTDAGERPPTLNLAEIEARLKAATPGPWESDGDVVGWWGGQRPAVRIGHSVPTRPGLSAPLCMVEADNKSRPVSPIADAALIANAPTDIAALLGALRETRAALTRLRIAHHRMDDAWIDGDNTARALAQFELQESDAGAARVLETTTDSEDA